MPRVFAGISCVFMLMVLFASADVWAQSQGLGNRFSREMPEIPYYSDEKFAELTTEYNKRPYGDDTLAYSINIPNDWEQGDEKGSSNFMVLDRLFIELNLYHGPPRLGGRSRVEVRAMNMDYDFTAEQWYLKYILESGYTLDGFTVHSDRRVESLMVVMEGDFSFHVRTVAQINGKRIITASYYLPAPYWLEEAAMQASVIRSFNVVNDTVEQIGNFKKFQFLDVAEVFYPDVWKVYSPPMRSVEKMKSRFFNIRNAKPEDDFDPGGEKGSALAALTDGQVDITIVTLSGNSSLLEEIKNYKKEMEATGILVSKKLDFEPDLKFNENVTFSIGEIYEGIDSSSDFVSYELWFTVFVAGNYSYFITLMTPSRNENYIAWAKNIQGYKQIVSSMAPTSGSYIER